MSFSLGKLLVHLGLDKTEFESGAASATKSVDSMASRFSAAGSALMPLSVGLFAAGGAAIAAGISMDNAADKIRIGTGATGDALAGLKDSFDSVFTTVPASAADVATAIADLNTRTGATGPVLEGLATQLLNIARLNETQVGPLIAATTRVFGDWSVATEHQSSTLDYLFKVSQSTGIGVDSLSQRLVQFGAPLRQMGFDLDTSAALLGKFEKEGVNTELVLGSLRIALTKMAKEGVTDAKAGLESVIASIKGAGSAGEANALALQVFGARAGPDMAAAIREGRFEIGEFVSSLQASNETVAKAAAETDGFQEQLILLKNKVTEAAEPIGTRLLVALESAMPAIVSAIGAVASAAEWFGNLPEPVQTAAIAAGALVAALGPVLLTVGAIIKPIAAVVGLIGGAAGLVVALKAAAVVGLAVGTVFGAWKLAEWFFSLPHIKAGLDLVVDSLKTFWSWIQKIPGVKQMVDSTGVAFSALKDKVSEFGSSVSAAAGSTDKTEAVTGKLKATTAATTPAVTGLTGALGALGKEHEATATKTKARLVVDEILAAQVQIISSRHQAAVRDLAAYRLSLAETEASTFDLVAENAKLTAGLGSMQSQAQIVAATTLPAVFDSTVKVTESIKDLEKTAATKVPETAKHFDTFTNSVSTAITNFSQDITRTLFSGDMSWAEKGKSVLASLGKAVSTSFIEPATAAISKFIAGALADLIGGKGFGGVMDGIKGIGGALSGVFGGGSGGGSAAGSVAGAAGSAGGIGGAVSGAAGAMNVVGAVSGVVSAVSGVISNFQFAAMNKSLDLIETSARYIEGYTHAILDKINLHIPNLDLLLDAFYTHHMPAWAEAISELQALVGLQRDRGPDLVIHISGNTFGSDYGPEDIAREIATQLRLQGVGA